MELEPEAKFAKKVNQLLDQKEQLTAFADM